MPSIQTEPSRLSCAECKTSKPSRELWWCRECARTLCNTCNLVNRHTEHRTAPWKESEVLRSCLAGLQARCGRRARDAADEEIAIKEFLAEVESRLLLKVQKQLEETNRDDRRKIAAISAHLTKEVGKGSLLSGFNASRSVSDTEVSRLLVEAKSVAPELDPVLDDCSPPPSLSAKRIFAVLPIDLSAEDFTQILEVQTRNGCQPRQNGYQGSFGDVWSSSQFPSGDVAKFAGNDVSTSTPLDQDEKAKFHFPLEPRVNISTDPLPRAAATRTQSTQSKIWPPGGESGSRVPSRLERSSSLAMDSFSLDGSNLDLGQLNVAGRSSVQLLVNEDTQTARLSLLTSATQTEEGRTPTPNHGTGDDSGERRSSSSDSTRINILSFHFGSDYLTRPIDVAALSGERLAISDSCGGIYITKSDGEVLHQIPTEGSSASSLYYSAGRNLLFVSLLHKRGRVIRIFDGQTFSVLRNVPCPEEPPVDQSRTRWLAASDAGDLFACSGDNHVSAVWKYNQVSDSWATLKESQGTRYQYLQVVQEDNKNELVLMVCDGATGDLLLLVVRRNGRLEREYNLRKTYHLDDYVRSPASAVVDRKNNLLVLDYANGKLWILVNTGAGVRRLRVLAEFGAQQALGLTVNAGWCYVACIGNKRVQAIRYDDEADSF